MCQSCGVPLRQEAHDIAGKQPGRTVGGALEHARRMRDAQYAARPDSAAGCNDDAAFVEKSHVDGVAHAKGMDRRARLQAQDASGETSRARCEKAPEALPKHAGKTTGNGATPRKLNGRDSGGGPRGRGRGGRGYGKRRRGGAEGDARGRRCRKRHKEFLSVEKRPYGEADRSLGGLPKRRPRGGSGRR